MAEQTIDPEVQQRLGLHASRRRPWRRWAMWGALLLAVVAAFVLWRGRGGDGSAGGYVTAPVRRGDLAVSVTATGTLQALDTVEVGSEVSGRVLAVQVDYNDQVRAGQVLATLDPEQAQARAEEAAAQVAAAAAAQRRAAASAEEARQNLTRLQRLHGSGLISPQDLDAAEATARRAEADVASARAQATVAEASLAAIRSNLEKTQIRAPIDGIVLARSVEPGQTVAASFQAPVLFTLARDLRQMTLHVDVDEADVGKVREGQGASFTVDAYPGRTFPSRVVSLRNVPKTDQNVVTYEAVLAVENAEMLLRPGMTGTATIRTEEKAGVLLVPNSALRFTPPDVLAAEGGRRGGLFIPGVTRSPWQRRNERQRPGGGAAATPGPGGGGPSAAAGGAAAGARPGAGAGGAAGMGPGNRQSAPAAAARGGGAPGGPGGSGRGPNGTRVWVLRQGTPEPVPVVTGATDGNETEVVDGALRPGDEVVVDVATAPSGRRSAEARG
jgi:HlyD family secretion protein